MSLLRGEGSGGNLPVSVSFQNPSHPESHSCEDENFKSLKDGSVATMLAEFGFPVFKSMPGRRGGLPVIKHSR